MRGEREIDRKSAGGSKIGRNNISSSNCSNSNSNGSSNIARNRNSSNSNSSDDHDIGNSRDFNCEHFRLPPTTQSAEEGGEVESRDLGLAAHHTNNNSYNSSNSSNNSNNSNNPSSSSSSTPRNNNPHDHSFLDQFNQALTLICLAVFLVLAFSDGVREENATSLLLCQILAFLFAVFFNYVGGHKLVKFLSKKWSNIWRSLDWVLRFAIIVLAIILSIERQVLSSILTLLISLNLYFNSNIGLPDPRDQELLNMTEEMKKLTKKNMKLTAKLEKLQAQMTEKYAS